MEKRRPIVLLHGAIVIALAGVMVLPSCSKKKGRDSSSPTDFELADGGEHSHESESSGADSPAPPPTITEDIKVQLEEQRKRCKEGDIPLKVLMEDWAMIPGDLFITYMVCRRGIREGAGLAACDELPEPMRESSRFRCMQLLGGMDGFILSAVKTGTCRLPNELECTGPCPKTVPGLCAAIGAKDPTFCSQIKGVDGNKCRAMVLGDPELCPASDDTVLGISSCTDLANAVQAAREGSIRSMPKDLERSTFARLTLARTNGEVCEALLRDHIQTEFCEKRF